MTGTTMTATKTTIPRKYGRMRKSTMHTLVSSCSSVRFTPNEPLYRARTRLSIIFVNAAQLTPPTAQKYQGPDAAVSHRALGHCTLGRAASCCGIPTVCPHPETTIGRVLHTVLVVDWRTTEVDRRTRGRLPGGQRAYLWQCSSTEWRDFQIS